MFFFLFNSLKKKLIAYIIVEIDEQSHNRSFLSLFKFLKKQSLLTSLRK
jgi:hypothetical protein